MRRRSRPSDLRSLAPLSSRLIPRRRREPARVQVFDVPTSSQADDGSLASLQSAAVTLPRTELDRMWTPEFLERLARTYWRFLSRISLGLVHELYTETSRELVLLGRPLVLLRFSKPEYEIAADGGTVTWRIERGLLVAPAGRGKGYLRISVMRPQREPPREEVTVYVSAEVASFYPRLAGARPGPPGPLSRLGKTIYGATQLRIHVIVTNAFLRSLARLDLVPSHVGLLRPEAPMAETAPDGAPVDPQRG